MSLILRALCAGALVAVASLQSAYALPFVDMKTFVDDRSPVVVKTKDKDKAGKKPAAIVTVKEIRAVLKNASREPITGAKVKFWFIGKGTDAPDTAVLDSDDKTVDLPPGTTVTVVSKQIKMTFQPGGTWADVKDGRATRHDESGPKFRGYGVRVSGDAGVLKEYFSTPTYKTLVDSPAAAPASANP
jgi:hypothetical protein